MKKNTVSWGIVILGITFSGIIFYHINHDNYLQHRTIQATIIKHPEKLPNSQAAKFGSFGFTNIVADMYWLQTIQYIGGNVIGGEYKKYLGVMINLITDLNPYFESPYTIGQLLIPSESGSYENTDNPENFKNYRDGEALGLKGVANFCDEDKITAIDAENNLGKIVNDPRYSNPCQSYRIPYYLAYIYYFYLKENKLAAKYYKVVSAQDDAPQGAKTLAAIMQGKGGEREKSLYMFLSLAQNSGSQNEACTVLSEELQDVYSKLKVNNIPLQGDLIRGIENLSKQLLPELSEENEDQLLDDTECTNFLAKSIREINLMYLEQADKKYVQDNPGEVSANTPQLLLQKGYIDFVPTDYQQYKGEEYGIIYKYSEEIGRFDYKMGSY